MARERHTDDLDERRTGGAGSRTNPLSDGAYRRQMEKLMALNRADSDDE